MPDSLSIAALQTLSDLKRAGVISTVRPCCGQDYCVCETAPHTYSLRDHAADKDAYDQAIDEPIRLHVVTAGKPTGPPCDGSMTCPCQACAIERSAITPRGAGPAAFAVRSARRAA